VAKLAREGETMGTKRRLTSLHIEFAKRERVLGQREREWIQTAVGTKFEKGGLDLSAASVSRVGNRRAQGNDDGRSLND